MTLIEKSRHLARWLRHRPDSIGLRLDKQGWANVAELLQKSNASGIPLTRLELLEIVAHNEKQRYTLSTDGTLIRAAQGHSIPVDLKLTPKLPPAVLYHGTVAKFLPAIRKHGLLPGTRQHVHLSAERSTAVAVGSRRGAPIVLTINTHPVVQAQFKFMQSENGVWLIDSVPARYIIFEPS